MVHQYYLVTVFSSVLRILENACKDDAELRAVLGDSIGNPELMRKRVCHTISTLHAYEGEQCWLYLTDLISVLDRLRKEFGQKVETFASRRQDLFLLSKLALESEKHESIIFSSVSFLSFYDYFVDQINSW